MTPAAQDHAGEKPNREKTRVALSSVLAAVVLTGTKLAVGVMTNSLGLLSEAAHSGLDLVAAFATFLTVRVSDRPADRRHPYGHGKLENLSALFQVLLLLGTCGWIVWEAGERLLRRTAEVEATFWAFAVIGLSIAVDFTRSRALRRAAVKYRSQALEADALHFSTDIWSSAVVLLGLAGVAAARATGLPWLNHADALAALAVALIVVGVSLQLGRKAVNDLLDAVPPELTARVADLIRVEGVLEVLQVRVRQVGPSLFADATVAVHGRNSAESAHEITNRAATAVEQVFPDADVVVHAEPVWPEETGGGVWAAIGRVAARAGLGVHAIHLHEVTGGLAVELHLEVPDHLSVAEAHRLSDDFEAALRREIPAIQAITTHLEPIGEKSATIPATPAESARVLAALAALPELAGIDLRPHEVTLLREDGRLSLSFHCEVEGTASLQQAHGLTEKLEEILKTRVPNLGRVMIHLEPR